jgi:hypothetical protein
MSETVIYRPENNSWIFFDQKIPCHFLFNPSFALPEEAGHKVSSDVKRGGATFTVRKYSATSELLL